MSYGGKHRLCFQQILIFDIRRASTKQRLVFFFFYSRLDLNASVEAA